MLHHFPQRLDLIRASVQHLHRKRLEAFEETLSKLNENADFTLVGEGIDAFWDQLQSPLFAVYCELLVASRTDAELKGMLAPAIRDFQTAWRKNRRAFSRILRNQSNMDWQRRSLGICWKGLPLMLRPLRVRF